MNTGNFGWSGGGGGGGGGGGTVTSVGLSMPSQFSVTNSPVITSGTLTVSWGNQSKNTVLAAPTSGVGVPTFRLLDPSDIPNLSYVPTVGLSMPGQFSVANSPIGSSGGTLNVSWQSQLQNLVLASPDGSSGVPSFRSLSMADMPNEVVTFVATSKLFSYYNFI
jgi:hypothetical protein